MRLWPRLGHGVLQGQVVHQADQFVQASQQACSVGHAGAGDAFQIAGDGALHGRQAGLGRALDALLGAFERGEQGLDAAGELGLLLRQAHGRFDVDHQVLVARARQALHQLLELGALQGHLADAGFLHRQPGRWFRATSSCAWRASVRASMAWALASALWRARCSWMVTSFCHNRPLAARATTADGAHRESSAACQPWRATVRGHRVGVTGCRLGGQARTHARDSIEAATSASVGGIRARWQSPAARAACAMRGWVATARGLVPGLVGQSSAPGWPGPRSC